MELIEREKFLEALQSQFYNVVAGEGHSVLITGEAGIGKTSLVRAFCKELKERYEIFQGTCDALFTPRPLAPLYDILLQLGSHLDENNTGLTNRSIFFARSFQELYNRKGPVIVIFEDIHWADEATLDFIKFFARRITRTKCLFILTYRDNEIHSRHPLRNIIGQLNPDSFSRLQLLPLSRQSVERMATEKGYNGEDVFSISGGIPFYVNEILASYSLGVPDNVRDSVLSAYNRLDEKTKHIWEVLSVLPTGFEVSYLEKIEPFYTSALENCLASKILIIEKGLIFFKHELYRRTIEESLSPLVRMDLNKKILEAFKENFEKENKIERIIHHAKNANDYDAVVQYAPMAAGQAATVGAHVEAAKLYLTAIEYYQGDDENMLLQFYEAYAYECYLTNQAREAIIYTRKALDLWKKKNNLEKIGNCMRFLSRLWWWNGNWNKAESFAKEAVQVLDQQPSSRAKAMAYSNMSQLNMLTEKVDECLYWGEKAISIAKEIGDEETLSHALNNVGSVKMATQIGIEEGNELLQQSLEIALRNSYNEHAARAFTNLACNKVTIKDYKGAEKIFEEGIRYCEERDLDSWASYMLSWKARMKLETGNWKEALELAECLNKNEGQTPIVRILVLVIIGTIKMRRGEDDALPLLLEARTMAFEAMESQRIVPVLSALLEYEWITGASVVDEKSLGIAKAILEEAEGTYENGELIFWLQKVRGLSLKIKKRHIGYQMSDSASSLKAVAFWEKIGCPYEQALALFECGDDEKRKAIAIVQNLGAQAVYEKMKFDMRVSGIKSIPRGIRKSTQLNPALLTDRELDVLKLLNEGLQNKEIAARLFISAKTVDHHISSIFYKLEVNTRVKAVHEAIRLEIIK